MNRILLALVGLLAATGPASAQFVFGPAGFSQYHYHSRFGFGFGGNGFAFGGGYRSYFNATRFYGPIAVGPWGNYYTPGYWGWTGPTVIVQPPPVVIIQAGGFAPAQGFDGGFGLNAPRRDDPIPRPDDAARRGDFVIVRPAAPRVVARKADPPANPFRPGDGAFAVPDVLPKDPKKRAAFHLLLARDAVASEQYGRAGERLADAIAASPDDPLAYFLLAQVRTAKGEYAEAVAAIRDGMKHAPDWPASGYRLRELYGAKPARFDEHLAELKRAALDHPNDATVLFLLGYHLWFLGEKAEAAKLFKKAVGKVRDGGVIERFLLEAEGESGVSLSSQRNVWNTCLRILRDKGFALSVEGELEPDGCWPAECRWNATKDGFHFVADNPIELLGLVAIYEIVKPTENRSYWWSLDGPDIVTELKEAAFPDSDLPPAR